MYGQVVRSGHSRPAARVFRTPLPWSPGLGSCLWLLVLVLVLVLVLALALALVLVLVLVLVLDLALILDTGYWILVTGSCLMAAAVHI